MSKYAPYSRRVLRRLFREWIRRNLRLFAVVTSGAVATFVAVTVFMVKVGTPNAFTWYALGAIQATLIACYVFMLHAAFLAHERAAIQHVRGAWGEENTRDELRRAKRGRQIWGWVDSISLQVGDLDHLVVTRHGGLLALDSKWRSRASAVDSQDMARAAARVRLRAEALAQTLLPKERGVRHRSTANPLTVKPVVVLWGPIQHTVPPGAEMAGIEFVAGKDLRSWLKQLDGCPISKDAAADVLRRLQDYRATSWDNALNCR